MGNLGLWIVLGIPRSYVHIKISPPLAQQSHEITHEKLSYMLKNDFQSMLVNFWCGNLGGPKTYILKSGGGGGPPGSSAYDNRTTCYKNEEKEVTGKDFMDDQNIALPRRLLIL